MMHHLYFVYSREKETIPDAVGKKGRKVGIHVPFPRPSFFTTKENKEFLALRDRFINKPPPGSPSDKKDCARFKVCVFTFYLLLQLVCLHFQELYKMVSAEQAEFFMYLENAAQECAEDYDYMHPDAHGYLIVRECLMYVS
jgi:hypothetical protein